MKAREAELRAREEEMKAREKDLEAREGGGGGGGGGGAESGGGERAGDRRRGSGACGRRRAADRARAAPGLVVKTQSKKPRLPSEMVAKIVEKAAEKLRAPGKNRRGATGTARRRPRRPPRRAHAVPSTGFGDRARARGGPDGFRRVPSAPGGERRAGEEPEEAARVRLRAFVRGGRERLRTGAPSTPRRRRRRRGRSRWPRRPSVRRRRRRRSGRTGAGGRRGHGEEGEGRGGQDDAADVRQAREPPDERQTLRRGGSALAQPPGRARRAGILRPDRHRARRRLAAPVPARGEA